MIFCGQTYLDNFLGHHLRGHRSELNSDEPSFIKFDGVHYDTSVCTKRKHILIWYMLKEARPLYKGLLYHNWHQWELSSSFSDSRNFYTDFMFFSSFLTSSNLLFYWHFVRTLGFITKSHIIRLRLFVNILLIMLKISLCPDPLIYT